MDDNILELYLSLSEEDKQIVRETIDFLLSLQSDGQQSPYSQD